MRKIASNRKYNMIKRAGIGQLVYGSGKKAVKKILERGNSLTTVKEGIDDILVLWGGEGALGMVQDALEAVQEEMAEASGQGSWIARALSSFIPKPVKVDQNMFAAVKGHLADRGISRGSVQQLQETVDEVIASLNATDETEQSPA